MEKKNLGEGKTKFLGIQIWRNHNFVGYLSSLSRAPGRNVAMSARDHSRYMDLKQKRMLMETFTDSQFELLILKWSSCFTVESQIQE